MNFVYSCGHSCQTFNRLQEGSDRSKLLYYIFRFCVLVVRPQFYFKNLFGNTILTDSKINKYVKIMSNAFACDRIFYLTQRLQRTLFSDDGRIKHKL